MKLLDTSTILTLTSAVQATSAVYNAALMQGQNASGVLSSRGNSPVGCSLLSFSVTNAAGTTQSAAVMASGSNVTHAVQSTAVLTVSDYANVAAGATITINGTVYTNGVDFTVGTSNNASATSIAAIATLPAGITASATNAAVTFVNTAYGTVGNANTITSSDAVRLTITASPWSNGVDAIFSKATHGLLTGVVGQMTTSSALPTGLSTSTNYWVIKVASGTFALASSLANAVAGTRIQFTDNGTGNQTFTPTSASGVLKLQESMDGVNYVDVSGDTITMTSASTGLWKLNPVYSQYYKAVFTPTSGAINATVLVNAWGEDQ